MAWGNELQHHGILGMKWGIRRFQPYPKGYSGDGKEVGEAAKPRKSKKDTLKKIGKTVAISAAIAAGTAVTISMIKASQQAGATKEGYESFKRLFGPEAFGGKDFPGPFQKEWYAKGLDKRVKANPIFKTHMSDADKMLLKQYRSGSLNAKRSEAINKWGESSKKFFDTTVDRLNRYDASKKK